jgi:outer membrane protein assembly factor BamB
MVDRKSIFTVLLALILLSIGSCQNRHDWIMFRGEEGRGATSNALHPPLGIRWCLQLQFEDFEAPAFNPPIVKAGTIYFGSPDGNFYALDIQSGYMRWVFKTEGVVNSIPFADEELVYFGSNDGRVYAVSLEDGKQAWSFQTESTVQSVVLRYGDTIVFTSDGGSTYFLSPEGELSHRLPNPVWHYDAFQLYENVMYFAPGPPSNPRSLGAFDMDQQAYLWILNTAALRATWYSFPALKGKYLHLATSALRGQYWELNYYAYDRVTGELIWKVRDESYFGEGVDEDIRARFRKNLRLLDYMAPSLWKNLVIYTSGDAVVRAYHERDGSPVWRVVFDHPTSSAPTVAGNRVYLGVRGDDTSPVGQKPRLVCLAARNGRMLWEMELEGSLLSAPVVAGKWLIFGTDKHLFYVLEELY